MLVGLSGKLPSTLEELLGRDLAARLDRLDLLSRKMLAGKLPGERRSKRRGRSVEFDDFRDYIPGDDLRHLDWNVLARLDRLVVKLFREDEDLALHLLVDASPSMNAGEPGKLAFAHALAMALAYIGVVNQNRVSVATFGGVGAGPGGLRQLAPVRGRPGVRRIADFLLASLRATGQPGATAAPDAMNQALRSLAQTRAGKGIVVVLSDLLTPAAAPSGFLPGLSALAVGEGGGYDTSVIQVLSPGELDPRAELERGLRGDLRLTDVETLRGAEVTLSAPLIARYRARVDAYIDDARRACRVRGIAHYLVTSDARIDQLVIGALRRGGMLR